MATATLTRSEFIVKPGVEAPVLFVKDDFTFVTVETGQAVFAHMLETFTERYGDSEVQADGSAFEVTAAPGVTFMVELTVNN